MATSPNAITIPDNEVIRDEDVVRDQPKTGRPPQTMVGRLADSIFGTPKPHSLVDMARGGSAPTLRDLGSQAVDTAKEFWRGLGDPVNLGMGAAFGGGVRAPELPIPAPLEFGGVGLPETAGPAKPPAPPEFTAFKDFPLQTQLGMRRAARLAVTPPKPGPVQGPQLPALTPFEGATSSATPTWTGQLPPVPTEPSVSVPTVQPKANLAPQANPQWFPEPRTETPIDRPGSMWSVERGTLPARAQRGQPGALDVLTNVGDRPPLVTPKPTLGIADPSFTDLRARYGLAVTQEPTEAGVPQGNATPFEEAQPAEIKGVTEPIKPKAPPREKPIPVERRYSPEEITDAEGLIQQEIGMMQSGDRPGSYFDEWEQGNAPIKQNLSVKQGERAGGKWRGVSSGRSMQPFMNANPDLNPAALEKALRNKDSAMYRKAIDRAMDFIRREKGSLSDAQEIGEPQVGETDFSFGNKLGPITTKIDAQGIRWASDGKYSVSIPHQVPESDVEAYAAPKLREQAEIHGKLFQ